MPYNINAAKKRKAAENLSELVKKSTANSGGLGVHGEY